MTAETADGSVQNGVAYPRPDLLKTGVPQKFEYSQPIIDAHTHWYSGEFVELVVTEGGQNNAKISGPDESGTYTMQAIGRGHGAGYYPYRGSRFMERLIKIEWQLERMEDRGVDLHSIGMTHPKIYWAPPEFALRLARAQNDGLSELHQQYPDRFMGQIILPLQDVNLSLQELERAAALPGLRGINLGHHVNGLNASDKSFWPLWARCEELDQPLMMHNIDPLGPDRLYQGGVDLVNSLGNPFEATLAAVSMIVSGMLDEFPGLDVYLPHAGGALPWIVGRIDYQIWRGFFSGLALERASQYLGRFYYDLILHDPILTRTMIELVGVDRIVSGTDWPQGMSVWRPVEYVETIPDITQDEAEAILCRNPAKLLRLTSSTY
ncbi:hypothetical protein E1212_08000 [Jiangella ureilytica]|uniref:Amidohydrolase-related domain-containing protein n=1 Tax=Jiangella ureilytica TaxID=2530374 RepID=A0A4V2XXD7_9ACTN|nr:amidohydrolase family protein [Jiangella ureilytica]TDC52785.1 hypothetical protein E1212_08000 [Jiangella ureilytica]